MARFDELTPSPMKSIIRTVSTVLPSFTRGSNSVVECNLAKVEVAGSNPVSRSIDSRGLAPWLVQVIIGIVERWIEENLIPRSVAPLATFLFWARGGIPKWLRERSAKPRFGGSNPPAASIFPQSFYLPKPHP